MKSVLISIRPQWCEKIASGQKTIEVRKTAPKEMPFKAYIYCTNQKINGEILLTFDKKVEGRNRGFRDKGDIPLAGKVIGEFVCDKIDEYTFSHYEAEYRVNHIEQKAMCLNHPELIRYGVGRTLYGWHISDLKIYDKPKELSEFNRPCSYAGLCFSCHRAKFTSKGDRVCEAMLTRPPMSWCYVEELRNE